MDSLRHHHEAMLPAGFVLEKNILKENESKASEGSTAERLSPLPQSQAFLQKLQEIALNCF